MSWWKKWIDLRRTRGMASLEKVRWNPVAPRSCNWKIDSHWQVKEVGSGPKNLSWNPDNLCIYWRRVEKVLRETTIWSQTWFSRLCHHLWIIHTFDGQFDHQREACLDGYERNRRQRSLKYLLSVNDEGVWRRVAAGNDAKDDELKSKWRKRKRDNLFSIFRTSLCNFCFNKIEINWLN